VTESVGSDLLVDPGCLSDASNDAGGGVPVEAFAVVAEQDRSLEAFPDGEVDGAGGAG